MNRKRVPSAAAMVGTPADHQQEPSTMDADDPIAFFITWTVYGTHLQGDETGWRKWRRGNQEPRPRLAHWHQGRLKYAVLLLVPEQRVVVQSECQRHCDYRGWRLWAVNARTNHVHAVVTADGCSGKVVRDQLKANCTRGLREQWPVFCDRPVWTVGGDWRCINKENELENACAYVLEAQDRKDRDIQDQPPRASVRFPVRVHSRTDRGLAPGG